MGTYSQRHHALCEIIDELPLPSSSNANRFQVGDATASYDSRSFKLDHYQATARSRKGKEVDRFGEHITVLRVILH